MDLIFVHPDHHASVKVESKLPQSHHRRVYGKIQDTRLAFPITLFAQLAHLVPAGNPTSSSAAN